MWWMCLHGRPRPIDKDCGRGGDCQCNFFPSWRSDCATLIFTGSDSAHEKESLAHFFMIFANLFGVRPIFGGTNFSNGH
jgi:hypothetical protein